MGKNICDTCIEDCKQPEFSVTIMCRNYKTQDMVDNPPEKKKRKLKVVKAIEDPLNIEDEIENQLKEIMKDSILTAVKLADKPKTKRKYTKRKKT